MTMAEKNGRFFVVTGMHRSGTTLTGRILSLYPDLHVIHEPLNKEYGVSGVHHIYPCDMNCDQGRYYLGLLDKLLSGRAGFVRHVPEDRWTKAIVRAIIGGRTGFNTAGLRLRKLVSRFFIPVFKDPFEVLMSRSLIERGARVIALVRHPMAIWLSIRRMGWRFSYADFAYPGVFADLVLPAPTRAMDTLPEIEKFAWLWMVIYSYLDRLVGNERLLLVRHEDLCLRPYEELQRIETFLDLPAREKARDFIYKHMFAETVTAKDKRLHSLERDSRKLASSWYGRLERYDEPIIKDICRPLVEHYYGQWKPV